MSEAAARHVLDAVREDPNLAPVEKETTLRLGKPENVATVYTAEAGITRRLLAHPHVLVEGVTTLNGGACRDVSLDEYCDGQIVGVRANVPVGALQVKLTPRADASHAEIVTDRVFKKVSEA